MNWVTVVYAEHRRTELCAKDTHGEGKSLAVLIFSKMI